MTIRANINVRDLNTLYSAFERGCDRAPDGVFSLAKGIRQSIGDACDALLADLKLMNVNASNCDGIREIEVMMFGMVAENNRDATPAAGEINQVVGLGYLQEGATLDATLLALDRARRARAAVNDA